MSQQISPDPHRSSTERSHRPSGALIAVVIGFLLSAAAVVAIGLVTVGLVEGDLGLDGAAQEQHAVGD